MVAETNRVELNRAEDLARRIDAIFAKEQGEDVKLVAKALVYDRRGNLLLLHDASADRWDLPGGHLTEGEKPDNGIRREIREETGLEVDGLKQSGVRVLEFGGKNHPVLIYEAHIDRESPDVTLSSEHDEYKWTGNGSELLTGAYAPVVVEAKGAMAAGIRVRDQAEEDFAAAVHRVVARAEERVINGNFEQVDPVAVEILMGAAAGAFVLAAPRLATIARGEDRGDHATEAEAQEYSYGRKGFYQNFSQALTERLERVAKEVEGQSFSDAERAAAVRREGAEAAGGVGQRLAETEAQSVIGSAQLRALRRAGYTTVRWVTVGDDRVRESHTACEAAGVREIGQRFPNGLLYPGDPAGTPAEVCNCRCWLEGVHRE